MVRRLPPVGTTATLRIPPAIVARLRCPACRSELRLVSESCFCGDARCGRRFPIVAGVPVLIHEPGSLFSIDEVMGQGGLVKSAQRRVTRPVLRHFTPRISANPGAAQNYRAFRGELLKRSAQPMVLIVGGATLGAGLEAILPSTEIRFVESDVRLSPRTALVCDAHDIPFADETFDGVVMQAVLEHVADPARCVAEVRRVLRRHGVVYAETAFMQQVHAGPHDFTRFTHLGHRRLFGGFDEIASGAVAGPGTALAWAWQHLLLSFATSRPTRLAATAGGALTGFWLKYLDCWLIGRPGSIDAASAFYFLGAKSRRTISDRELVTMYRGAQ